MGKVENEGMPVVRLDRQLKYQGNILKIYEDTVLANGHEAHWDYIHHDGAAAGLPVTSEGKILMVRQYRNALNRYTLEIPAGKLDAPDEPKIEWSQPAFQPNEKHQPKYQYNDKLNPLCTCCFYHILKLK